MASIFTRIHKGEIPGKFVAQTDEFFAVLDINPLNRGHVLVIPVQETDYLFDLAPDFLGRYMQFAQKVAKAIEQVVACERIGVAVIGLEVPHAHIHLVPIDHVGDINFSKPKLMLADDELESIRERISEAFTLLDQDSSR
ncbi:MAG: HIT family protein [Flavobacteriales bacterium]|nr:HIT family protein [Flavobacteriales bacterium]